MILWNWLDGRSSTEMSRIADGPNRAPVRKLAAVSNGIPMIATSAPASAAFAAQGSRMNVRIPENRGLWVALGTSNCRILRTWASREVIP